MPVPRRTILAGAATAAALLTAAAPPASAAPAGALDRDWSGDGVATLAFGPGTAATAVASTLMPDGDLVVVGVSMAGAAQDWIVARFLPDGTPDPAFGDGGRVTLDVDSVTDPVDVVPLPGDRVLVGGTAQVGLGTPDIVALRLNAGGQVDMAYGGGDGQQTFGIAGWRDTLGAMAVDEQGRPYLVGSTGPANANAVEDDLYVARLTTGGLLDTTFSGDGQWTFAVDGNVAEQVNAADVRDDKLVVGGRMVDADAPGFVARFFVQATPSQDLTFGPNGTRWIAETGSAVEVDAVVQLPDGRVRLAGDVEQQAFLQGLTEAGTPDPAFLGGQRTMLAGAEGRSVGALVVEPGGGLVAAGKVLTSPTAVAGYVRRMRADGSLDPAFAGGGEALVTGPALSGLGAVEREPDGDLLVSGTAGASLASLQLLAARFNGTGKADPAPQAPPAPPAPPAAGPNAPAAPAAPAAPPVTAPPVATTPKRTPRAADVIALPSPRTCLSRRRIALRLKAPQGAKVVSATARIGGGKVRKLRGSQVSLRGLPKGAVKVTVTAKLSTGQTLTLKRAYTTCAKKKARKAKRKR